MNVNIGSDTQIDRDALIAEAMNALEAAKANRDYRTVIAAVEVIAKLAGLWIGRREVGAPGSFSALEKIGTTKVSDQQHNRANDDLAVSLFNDYIRCLLQAITCDSRVVRQETSERYRVAGASAWTKASGLTHVVGNKLPSLLSAKFIRLRQRISLGFCSTASNGGDPF
jgi:hypothetical protein